MATNKAQTIQQILAHRRLHNTKLVVPRFSQASQVVGWLGAVQSQDYAGAKWSLAQRMRSASDAALEDEFARGAVLRTHMLRPTWHFVLPEDIRWMQALTSPRVHALNASIVRREGIHDKALKRGSEIIAKALSGRRYLTRAELGAELERGGIRATGLGLAYIVMYSELEAVICSGPRRGKQFTYALLEERAPNAKRLEHEEALATLCTRYFSSHGPATLHDFCWWSGLTLADAKAGVEEAKAALVREELGGRSYWSGGGPKIKAPTKIAALMSTYDEYVLSYKDRSHLGNRVTLDKIISTDNFQFILINGQIVGSWRRALKGTTVSISLRAFTRLSTGEKQAIRWGAEDYAGFLGLGAKIQFSS